MTGDNTGKGKSGLDLDWLIGGVLTKVGDTFDRVTGRNWNPSSSLATSRLEEKLRAILDAEAMEVKGRGVFVPHLFQLKVQWNKFSTDSEEELRKLEHELHAAAIDHINDRLYHTFEPISVSVAKDYFVEGVQFIASYGAFAENEGAETAIDVTLTNIPVGAEAAKEEPAASEPSASRARCPVIRADYSSGGKSRTAKFDLSEVSRIAVGRAATNDLVIDDESVSKTHAAIAFKESGEIVIADTGSTNGTFIGGVRIPYGKAHALTDGTAVKFGDIETRFSIEMPEDGEVAEQVSDVEDPSERKA